MHSTVLRPLHPTYPPCAFCPSCQSVAVGSLAPSGKSVASIRASRARTKRGVSRSSRTLGAGCDGRFGNARRAWPKRAAKSCGPDLPTLGSSLRVTNLQITVANKARYTEESAYKPSHHRAGNAGCFGEPVVTNLRVFYFYTQGCVSCTGIPCALFLMRDETMHHPGAKRAAGMWSHILLSCPALCGASSIPEAPRLTDRRLWNTGRAMTPSELFDM